MCFLSDTQYNTPEPDEAEPENGTYLNIPAPDLEENWPFPRFPAAGPGLERTWSSVITVFPRPIIPCFYCDSEQIGLIRFLNTATGYNPFLIYINNQMAVSGLDNGELSHYGRVSAELLTITIADRHGYVYIEKQIQIPADGAITVAIINTDTGPDLMEITDEICNGDINSGCFRVCNLSITNRRMNIILNPGPTVFSHVNYKEATDFQYILTGFYEVFVYRSNVNSENVILSSDIYIRGNASYTLFIFNWSNYQDAIRILIVEDRRN